MAALMPLNFGIILYADAMRELGQGASRSSQAIRFRAAAEALRRLARAIAELGMADPMSEEIGWAAEAESLVCAASVNTDGDLAARLAALEPAPGEQGTARREAKLRQAFVTLVNSARYEIAQKLMVLLPELSASRESLGQDAVYARAMLALQQARDPAQAYADFAWLREQLLKPGRPANLPLFWSALRGEAQALALLGRDSDAAALLDATLCAMAAHGEAIPADLAPRMDR
jgi:hypothetical protein